MIENVLSLLKGKKKKGLFPGEEVIENLYDTFCVEDNFIIRPDGVLTMGLFILPMEAEKLSIVEHNKLNGLLNDITKGLPPGTVIHLQRAANYKTLNLGEGDGYFTRRIKNNLSDRPVLSVQMALYVSFDFYRMKTRGSNRTWLRAHGELKKALKDAGKNPFGLLSEKKHYALNRMNAIMASLNGMKLFEVKRMLDNDLYDRLYEYHNLAFGAKEINRLTSAFYDEGNYVTVGNKRAAFVSLQEPGMFSTTAKENKLGVTDSMCAYFDGLSFPHVINTSIYIHNTAERLGDIDKQNRLKNAFAQFSKQAGEVNVKKSTEFTREARENDRRLVSLEQNVMVWGYDNAEIEAAVNEVTRAFSEMNNSMAIVAPNDAFNFFTTFSPGMAIDMFNGRLMASDEALCYFNFSAPTSGNVEGLLFCNRLKEPILVDLWNGKLTSENRNAIVAGPPGSGKSFLVNTIICQNYEKGYHQIIIDVDGSYKNLVEQYKGEYKEYRDDVPLTFNPFVFPKKDGLYYMTDDKEVFLISLITSMWKNIVSGEGLDNNEKAVLTQILNGYVYRLNKTINEDSAVPSMDGFYEFIEYYIESNKENDKVRFELALIDTHSLLLVLKKYTTPANGRYSDLLNARTNTNPVDNRLICYDLAGIKENPEISPIVTLLIIDTVIHKVNLYPTIQKLLHIDEAWAFIAGSPQMIKFIESMLRTIRKKNGGVYIITQSILDLKKSPIGDVIRGNTAIKILLNHGSQLGQMAEIKSYLGKSEIDMEKLKSIRVTDKWREVWIDRLGQSEVFILDPGPHLATAFSSWATDRAEVKKMAAMYEGRIDMAIDVIVEKKLQKTNV
jgi:DNA replication protein DnaC